MEAEVKRLTRFLSWSASIRAVDGVEWGLGGVGGKSSASLLVARFSGR
jgi:hypothetical protein